MKISRRSLMGAVMSGVAAPALAQPKGISKLIRFIPQADLTVLDPMWTTAYVTRNHGFMVFDTLFGQDSQFRPSPQMVAGFKTEDDGKLWTLGLRSGLKFHDGEPVRAQDCVASIKRWAVRDAFGQSLMAATDELSAKDDRTIVFRLKRPFPLLPDRARQDPALRPGDHAGAAGDDRSLDAGHRDGRQRPVPVRRRRAHPGCQSRLRALQGLHPPRGRHRGHDRRAQGRQRRPGRVDHDPRPDHGRAGADQRRAGLVGLRERRPAWTC